MTESRDEMVVRMAAAFPWAEYNKDKPISVVQVLVAFPLETVGIHGFWRAEDVVKLVNERPADPFDGIVAPADAIVRRRS